jgi:transcriptional regulator with XRE-family HTH domain
MKSNDKKQRAVAEKLGISTSSLHEILRKDQLPSLKIAYKIEQYTHGAITLYDWLDQGQADDNNSAIKSKKDEAKEQKIKKQ